MSQIDLKQLEFIDKKLRKMHSWIEEKTGLTFTITSIYRIGDNGVHGQLPCRGIDLRIRNKAIGKEIEELINNHWIYDHNRHHLKCCILHGEGSNMHLHIQVHPNTKYTP